MASTGTRASRRSRNGVLRRSIAEYAPMSAARAASHVPAKTRNPATIICRNCGLARLEPTSQKIGTPREASAPREDGTIEPDISSGTDDKATANAEATAAASGVLRADTAAATPRTSAAAASGTDPRSW